MKWWTIEFLDDTINDWDRYRNFQQLMENIEFGYIGRKHIAWSEENRITIKDNSNYNFLKTFRKLFLK